MSTSLSGGRAKKARKSATGASKTYEVIKTSHGKNGGRYKGSGPAAAAAKAANKRFTSAHTSITLTIREFGTYHTFSYRVVREKLPKPYVSVIKGREIVRKYKAVVHAL
jgi:hypothetical protein